MFGSLAKGYKAGGYNSVQIASRFENEDVWNFEAGVKTLFADLGLAAERLYVLLRLPGQAGDLAGHGRRWLGGSAVRRRHERRGAFGVELDARWQPVDALTLIANVAWIDATYKDKFVEDGDEIPICRASRPANRPLRLARRELLCRSTAGASSTCRRCTPIAALRAATRSSELQGSLRLSPGSKWGRRRTAPTCASHGRTRRIAGASRPA